MKLAMTVTHPEHPDQDLLRRNFVLDQAVLDKMRSLGIACLFVDYPGLEDLDKHLAPNLSPERQALYTKVRTTLSEFQRDAAPTVNFVDYYAATRDFVAAILQNGRNPIYLDELSSRLGADGVRHSMAVAHMALVIGIKLERYLISQRQRLATAQAREVVNLGVAGMLHDLGKTKLPEKLRPIHGVRPPLDEAERAEWESHTRIGYDIIREEVEVTAAAAVLNHHQHFDGSGFPTRDLGAGAQVAQDGERIHVYARILLTADLYDHLAIAEDGKTRRSNLEILDLIRKRYSKWLDPNIAAVLPMVVPPFPPGSRVTLSDGRMAIVTTVNLEDPYRPTVKLVGADGWTPTAEGVVLATHPELSVASIGGIAVGDMAPPPVPTPTSPGVRPARAASAA
jgi:HD-GYP domain-containing protein (c-di-GMP phosphodiesterase class II)